jgi:hypothetical protein
MALINKAKAKGFIKDHSKYISVCFCGHTGEGKRSQHANEPFFSFGSGKCLVKGCDCTRFTWKCFIRKF